ncbi:MAG: hypothetical protein CMM77_17215 [Rhodospirillaceae bacterium]|nr:hypothetical protein [Magnetovibrio sp.]MAY68855.1 hypothetical protein [Rhodospirillaceae bacterium]|tara:strand:+ start:216 stop:1799 length:1584 start_codon:yes stop_codon:yes gene_type:complete
MKEGFRQSMSWLHTWGGLITGWILFFVFLTGTAGYGEIELDRWMRPEKPLVAPEVAQADALALGLKFAETTIPDARRWLLSPPGGREQPELRYFIEDYPETEGGSGKRFSGYLDPATGEKTQYRATGGGRLLYRMHYQLHYIPRTAAAWIVGFCAMAMFAALVTGIIIHARIFKDFFTFRPGTGHRNWLDAHNVVGVLSLPFHLMITYSGLMFLCYVYMAPVIAAEYGWGEDNRRAFTDMMFLGHPLDRDTRRAAPAPSASLAPMLAEADRLWGPGNIGFVDITRPGTTAARVRIVEGTRHVAGERATLVFDGVTGTVVDGPIVNPPPRAISKTLISLHEGLFAGPVLRWLYFLAGLMGTAMIGSGLILWTKKRRARLEGRVGFSLVERLNVATVCGLSTAVAAYLWANRLLPVEMSGRAAWEAHVMFLVWAVMAAHAALRPAARAWSEQCGIAAAAFGLIPLVNALTTDRHLGASIAAGQWDLAAVDLTCLAIGIGFVAAARIAARGHQRAVPAKTISPTVHGAAE